MKNKDMIPLIEKLRQLGWRVERTGKMHYRFLSPNKSIKPVIHSSTPSDPRSFPNVKARLRRAGAAI